MGLDVQPGVTRRSDLPRGESTVFYAGANKTARLMAYRGRGGDLAPLYYLGHDWQECSSWRVLVLKQALLGVLCLDPDYRRHN